VEKALVEIRPAKDSLNRRIISVEVGCDSPSGSHLGIQIDCPRELKHSLLFLSSFQKLLRAFGCKIDTFEVKFTSYFR
jgi:hypothetical protein